MHDATHVGGNGVQLVVRGEGVIGKVRPVGMEIKEQASERGTNLRDGLVFSIQLVKVIMPYQFRGSCSGTESGLSRSLTSFGPRRRLSLFDSKVIMMLSSARHVRRVVRPHATGSR